MVKIPQTHLILRKQNDMVGSSGKDHALGPAFSQMVIDSQQVMDSLLLQHLHQLDHDETANLGIIAGAVMIEIRQLQSLGHHIQLVLVELRHQLLGKGQRVGGGQLVFITQPLALSPDETGVKFGVMSHDHTVTHKFQELGQNLFDFRCSDQHFVVDAGQINDLLAQLPLRIHQSLEPLQLLALLHNDGTDLDDPVFSGIQAGGFQIESHKFLIKGHIPAAGYDLSAIHIIDVVALASVEHLNWLVGPGDLCGTLAFYCVHGIREGMDTAVVRNGNRPMSPGRSLLDGCFGIRQSIHITHGGMQMQLYPLHTRGRILTLGHRRTGHHREGLEHKLIVKLIDHQLALYPEHRTDLHIFQHRLGLSRFHEAVDTDGAGIVGHIKVDHPGIPLFQFLVFDGKYLTFHHYAAHIQCKVLHRNRVPPERLAIEGFAGHRGRFLFGRSSCHLLGQVMDPFGTVLLHGIKECLPFQHPVRFNGNPDRSIESLAELSCHYGSSLFQCRTAIGLQMYSQFIFIPLIPGSGQRSPGHRVLFYEKITQFLMLNALELLLRVTGNQCQLPQPINPANVPAGTIKQPQGDVVFGKQLHFHPPGWRIDLGIHNGRLR